MRKTRKWQMTGRTRSRVGFTLIELLVVVSIIALLIAILLPSLKAAREQTRSLKCMANQRSMGQGIALYGQDENDILPGPLHPPVFRKTGSDDPNDAWEPMRLKDELPWFLLYRLAPYFTKHDTFIEYTDAVATCPTALQKSPDANFKPKTRVPGTLEINPDYMRPYHYLINSWDNTAPTYYFGWINTGYGWGALSNPDYFDPADDIFNPTKTIQPPKPLTMIKRPSAEWSVGDAWFKSTREMVRPGVFNDLVAGTWQLGEFGKSRLPLPRKPYHGSGGKATNLIYFDGHAATFVGTSAVAWNRLFPANKRETD